MSKAAGQSPLLPDRHRAIWRTGKGVAVRWVPTPRPGPGGIVIAPLVAGLCGTDIQMLRGERADPAAVIGHEGLARIAALGSGVPPGLRVGDKVMINPTHPNDPDFLLGHTIGGLFQEYVAIPASAVAGGLVMAMPAPLPLRLVPLVEPLASTLYAFEALNQLQPPKSFLIYGDGIVGHLAVWEARRRFGAATRVILVHGGRDGLTASRTTGIAADLDLLFDELPQADGIFADGNAPAAVLLATPRRATLACLSHALSVIAPHGVIDMLGGLPADAALPDLPGLDLARLRAANCCNRPIPPLRTMIETLQGKAVTLCGHRGVSNDQMAAAAAALVRDGASCAGLVTRLVPLDAAAAVMARLQAGGGRTLDGQRFLKLAVSVAGDGLPVP